MDLCTQMLARCHCARFLAVSACLVVCATVLRAQAHTADAPAEERAGLKDAVRCHLTAWHEANRFHGCALVVLDGEVLAAEAYGLANREWDIANTIDTRFLLQSISKQFTSVMVLQLAEEGLLDLDDPLTKHLPWYRQDTGERITIDHLLRHTSGLPRYVQEGEPTDPGRERFNWQNRFERDDLVETYMSGDLRFEPGERYEYCNTGYYLLALVIEAVTGETYETNLRMRLLKPLGMRETGLDRHERLIPHRAEGYVKIPGGFARPSYEDRRNLLGVGDIASTVGDLRRWNEALTSGALLSPEMQTLMMTPYAQSPGEAHAYSMNFFGARLSEDLVVRYRGFSGGAPGFMTDAFNFDDIGLLVILLDNSSQYEHWRIAPEIYALVQGHDVERPRPLLSDSLAQRAVTDGVDAALAWRTEQLATAPDTYETGNLEQELNGLGYASMAIDDVQGARAVLELNQQLHPGSWNTYDSLADACAAAGENERSAELRAKGEAIRTREDRLLALLRAGEMEEALREVERVRAELDASVDMFTPSRIGPLFGQALAEGKAEQARAICEVWAAGNPSDVGPWFSMQRACAQLGDTAGEMKCCERLLELVPDHPRAEGLRQRLDELKE